MKQLLLGFCIILSVIAGGCSDDNNDPIPSDEDTEKHIKPKYLWFDASANFERFSYLDSIKYYLDRSVEIGITDIVVDVRPVCGDVLYKSTLVDELVCWKGFEKSNNWDYLGQFISEGKKRNLRVHASLNVFSGGHNYFDSGIVYRDSEMGKLTTTLNKPEGMTDIIEIKTQYAAFFNPADPKVQKYCLDILKEVTAHYNLDGIILDRCRFDGLDSDFSEVSKGLFEQYINQRVTNYPGDIFEWKKNTSNQFVREPGELYSLWLEWRAKIIYDFFLKAKEELKAIKPELSFATYAGGWYPNYYEFGVNWASKQYDPKADHIENWMYTSNYKNFGYAELLDAFLVGVYYGKNYGEGWYTIEGGLWKAKVLTKGEVPVIGSLYADIYKDLSIDMSDAVELCLQVSDGLMIFDIVQVIQYDLWDEIKNGIDRVEKEKS